MANAAYPVTLSVRGSSLQMTDEPTTRITSRQYQITDVNKRFIDSDQGWTVGYGGASLDSRFIDNIDFNNGIINFFNDVPDRAGIITFNAYYFNLSKILGANSFDLSITSDILDDTEFGPDGYRTKVAGISDCSLNVSRFFKLNEDYFKLMQNRDRLYVTIQLAEKKDTITALFVIESNNLSGDVGGLETSELSLQQTIEPGKSFSWVSS